MNEEAQNIGVINREYQENSKVKIKNHSA